MSKKIEELREELKRLEMERDNFEVSDYVSNDSYDNFLDEVYGDKDEQIEVCGLKYRPSYALSEIDPIAYRCGFSDYCDGIEKETIEEYRQILEKIEEIEEEIEEEEKNE